MIIECCIVQKRNTKQFSVTCTHQYFKYIAT